MIHMHIHSLNCLLITLTVCLFIYRSISLSLLRSFPPAGWESSEAPAADDFSPAFPSQSFCHAGHWRSHSAQHRQERRWRFVPLGTEIVWRLSTGKLAATSLEKSINNKEIKFLIDALFNKWLVYGILPRNSSDKYEICFLFYKAHWWCFFHMGMVYFCANLFRWEKLLL